MKADLIQIDAQRFSTSTSELPTAGEYSNGWLATTGRKCFEPVQTFLIATCYYEMKLRSVWPVHSGLVHACYQKSSSI